MSARLVALEDLLQERGDRLSSSTSRAHERASLSRSRRRESHSGMGSGNPEPPSELVVGNASLLAEEQHQGMVDDESMQQLSLPGMAGMRDSQKRMSSRRRAAQAHASSDVDSADGTIGILEQLSAEHSRSARIVQASARRNPQQLAHMEASLPRSPHVFPSTGRTLKHVQERSSIKNMAPALKKRLRERKVDHVHVVSREDTEKQRRLLSSTKQGSTGVHSMQRLEQLRRVPQVDTRTPLVGSGGEGESTSTSVSARMRHLDTSDMFREEFQLPNYEGAKTENWGRVLAGVKSAHHWAAEAFRKGSKSKLDHRMKASDLVLYYDNAVADAMHKHALDSPREQHRALAEINGEVFVLLQKQVQERCGEHGELLSKLWDSHRSLNAAQLGDVEEHYQREYRKQVDDIEEQIQRDHKVLVNDLRVAHEREAAEWAALNQQLKQVTQVLKKELRKSERRMVNVENQFQFYKFIEEDQTRLRRVLANKDEEIAELHSVLNQFEQLLGELRNSFESGTVPDFSMGNFLSRSSSGADAGGAGGSARRSVEYDVGPRGSGKVPEQNKPVVKPGLVAPVAFGIQDDTRQEDEEEESSRKPKYVNNFQFLRWKKDIEVVRRSVIEKLEREARDQEQGPVEQVQPITLEFHIVEPPPKETAEFECQFPEGATLDPRKKRKKKKKENWKALWSTIHADGADAEASKTVKHICKLINSVYAQKVMEDESADAQFTARVSMEKFIYQMFHNKYGLKELAERNVVELMGNCAKYAGAHKKIRLFATLCNINSEAECSASDLNFFLHVFRHVQRVQEINDDATQALGIEKANKIARFVFGEHMSSPALFRFVAGLQDFVYIKPRPGGTSKKSKWSAAGIAARRQSNTLGVPGMGNSMRRSASSGSASSGSSSEEEENEDAEITATARAAAALMNAKIAVGVGGGGGDKRLSFASTVGSVTSNVPTFAEGFEMITVDDFLEYMLEEWQRGKYDKSFHVKLALAGDSRGAGFLTWVDFEHMVKLALPNAKQDELMHTFGMRAVANEELGATVMTREHCVEVLEQYGVPVMFMTADDLKTTTVAELEDEWRQMEAKVEHEMEVLMEEGQQEAALFLEMRRTRFWELVSESDIHVQVVWLALKLVQCMMTNLAKQRKVQKGAGKGHHRR